ILDIAHWREDGGQRLTAVALTVLPPLVISLAGLGGFVSALSYAGGFAGAAMSILPVLMLRAARAKGELQPVWKVTWQAHPLIQGFLITTYIVAFIYSLAAIFGLLPTGWA
ncbi:MAG: aromatic amino acid transport family protein, partial [Rothia sp. (in: high G+C Gram-positive bacteria)]|nr:aromatic amino acid transport family protein [Rothia sp. (in: high G+C Gram-positive bacteria)]